MTAMLRVRQLLAAPTAHVERRGPNPLAAAPALLPNADARQLLAAFKAGPSLVVLLKLARRLGLW